MATIVYQGLQSCLESQIVEARTLRLKLSSPNSVLSNSLELALKPYCSSGSSNGGWTFLQELSNSTNVENENVYVHPMMNRYSSKLSEKSLELCTESLGCETGSNISSDNCFLFESSTSTSESEDEDEEVSNSNSRSNSNSKLDKSLERLKPGRFSDRSFPPPLTTMSAAESVQFQRRREGGRLIITAVKAPPAVRGCLQAERADGRLRLCFAGDFDSGFGSGENDGGEEEEMEENCEIEEEEDTEGNSEIVGGEIRKEGFAIGRRRCKEGERGENGLLNWEPFWVAT